MARSHRVFGTGQPGSPAYRRHTRCAWAFRKTQIPSVRLMPVLNVERVTRAKLIANKLTVTLDGEGMFWEIG